MVVADGMVVFVSYVVTGSDGQVLEQLPQPVPYLHGASGIVPGLENALSGLKAGEAFEVTVSPADAYGEKVGPPPQKIPKTAFPDDFPMKPGVAFQAQSPDGGVMMLFVAEVLDDAVMVTHLHPLAGQTLHYKGQIHEVRAASEEELSHGHVHGPGGHH